MTEEIKFTIPEDPITKKNHQKIVEWNKPRFSKKTGKLVSTTTPGIMPSSQYKQYERVCAYHLRNVPALSNDPVNVKALYYMGTRRSVDLTNLNEALHDILVNCGILPDDNCRIIVSTDGSRVYYDKDNPRTEVTITPAEPTFESVPARKKKA